MIQGAIIGYSIHKKRALSSEESGSQWDTIGHIQIEATIRIDVLVKERGETAPICVSEAIVPIGVSENLLNNQGIDVNQ